ncbi:MAG: hypothetical protein ACXVNM_09750 [Bacteroidia bacterium]
MRNSKNKKGPFNRTVILVSLFLLLLLCYFNLSYLKEKIRSFSLNKESSWSIERRSVEGNNAYYSNKEEVKILSPVFHLDKIYHSMAGPIDVFFLTPDNTPKNGIVWLTDYSVKVTDRKGKTKMSDEFLCHNNLDVAFSEILPQRKRNFNNRLIMVAQGQKELHFPEGFAIPLLSHDNISITTEALNHNIKNTGMDVRHEIDMTFIRNDNIKNKIKPLFKRAINLLVEADTCKNSSHGSGRYCRPPAAPVLKADTVDSRNYTGRWIIPTGLDTVKYDVTDMIAMPYVTTLHYASVHAYAYCVSLELKDLTTGVTVFDSKIKNYSDRMGIESMAYFSDAKGIEMDPSHHYQLVCVTNNTSGKPQDMMAGMILYFYDKEMEKNIENNFLEKN